MSDVLSQGEFIQALQIVAYGATSWDSLVETAKTNLERHDKALREQLAAAEGRRDLIGMSRRIEAVDAENVRLREALERIIDHARWFTGREPWYVTWAREALAGPEEENPGAGVSEPTWEQSPEMVESDE